MRSYLSSLSIDVELRATVRAHLMLVIIIMCGSGRFTHQSRWSSTYDYQLLSQELLEHISAGHAHHILTIYKSPCAA